MYARAAPPASSASPMLTSTSVMIQGDQLQGLDVQVYPSLFLPIFPKRVFLKNILHIYSTIQ